MTTSPAWVHAIPAIAAAGGDVLTNVQVDAWRSEGFTFVDGLFEPQLIAKLRADALAHFPTPGTPEAEDIADFGSGGRFTFPAASHAFNDVTLHPRLLRAIAQLLGVPVTELRLTQSDLWPKYGRAGGATDDADNDDQRIHVDYPNHTLAHPSPWHRPDAVEVIVYLDRVEECGGATALVPRRGADDPAYKWPIVQSPGIADLDWINDRTRAERYLAMKHPDMAVWRQSLYAREQQVGYKLGDVLFYRHDLWHRGTPLEPGRLRLAHNLTFRKAAAEWISVLHVGWAWSAYRRDKLIERLIAHASPEQRSVLGFPRPGSDYWCNETIDAVQARYGVFGIDMAPYRAALKE